MFAQDNDGQLPRQTSANFPFATFGVSQDPDNNDPSATFVGRELLEYMGNQHQMFFGPLSTNNYRDRAPKDQEFPRFNDNLKFIGYIYLGVREYDQFHEEDEGYVDSLSEEGRKKLFQDPRREVRTGPINFNHDPVNSVFTDGSVVRQNESDLKFRLRPGGPQWWW
jgi:hypothetical protein